MLVSAAVCPHPPALVPAVSQGAAGRLDDVRTACISAVRRLHDAAPDRLVTVGAGPGTRRWPAGAGGSLRALGVDAGFGGPERDLPLSLTVAAYLMECAGADTCDEVVAVAQDATADACAALGRDIAESAERVALLVMGDGSAKGSRQSPGYLDDRAAEFDAVAFAALQAADPEALLALEPTLAEQLWVAGRPAWQVLAGALLESPAPWRGVTDYAGAPLGVGYVVVRLTRTDA